MNNFSFPPRQSFYPVGTRPMQTPEQMEAELARTLQQYRNVYNETMNPQNQNYQPQGQPATQPVKQSGEYFIVTGAGEMENAATRLDGVPTIFISPNDRVLWMKAYGNGGHSVQAFHYEPITAPGNAASVQAEQAIDYVKDLTAPDKPKEDSNFETRLSRIETLLGQLTERMSQDGSIQINSGSERNNRPKSSAGNGTQRAGQKVTADSANAVRDD